jgi:hypothetical protein
MRRQWGHDPESGDGSDARLRDRYDHRDHSRDQQGTRRGAEAGRVTRRSVVRPAPPPGVVNHSACLPN